MFPQEQHFLRIFVEIDFFSRVNYQVSAIISGQSMYVFVSFYRLFDDPLFVPLPTHQLYTGRTHERSVDKTGIIGLSPTFV